MKMELAFEHYQPALKPFLRFFYLFSFKKSYSNNTLAIRTTKLLPLFRKSCVNNHTAPSFLSTTQRKRL